MRQRKKQVTYLSEQSELILIEKTGNVVAAGHETT